MERSGDLVEGERWSQRPTHKHNIRRMVVTTVRCERFASCTFIFFGYEDLKTGFFIENLVSLGVLFDPLRCHFYMDQQIIHVHMRSQRAREETFYQQPWPHLDFTTLHPKRLAAAGFFFDPASDGKDKCICFACGLQLVNWDPNDNPFGEHLKHAETSPEAEKCVYVQLLRQLNPVLLGLPATRRATIEEDGLMELEDSRDPASVLPLKQQYNQKRDFMKALLVSTLLQGK